MKKCFLISICCLLGSIALRAQDTQTVSDAAGLYTVEIPANWVQGAARNLVANFMAVTSVENTGLQIWFTTGRSVNGLKEATRINKRNLRTDRKNFPGFIEVEEGAVAIGGKESIWFTYTFTKEGKVLKGKYYTVKNGARMFTAVYTLPEDEFDAAEASLDAIIATMKIK